MIDIDRLKRLAGMAHYQGAYTPEEWRRKTGVDPRDFPGLIRVSRGGVCYWDAAAENVYRQHVENQAALGVALGVRPSYLRGV